VQLVEESRWLDQEEGREELVVPEQVKYQVDDQELVAQQARPLKDLAGTGLFAAVAGMTTTGVPLVAHT
jgi:hypothetical protein